MDNAKIWDWSLLNRDLADIVDSVRSKWTSLLDANEKESKYQEFLAKHAGFFFGTDGTSMAISHLALGSERQPDFVVVSDFRSAGLHYEFIELERPQDSPFSRDGDPSQRFSHAQQQVRDWKRWLDENQDFTKKFLPAKHHAGKSCSFRIIIGRRENSKEFLPERNQISNEYRVHVRSYDSLTDELDRKQFAHSCSKYHVHANEVTLNQLANPFFKAYSDQSWRDLIRRLERASYEGLCAYGLHFLSSAAPEVIQTREFNALFEKFKRRHP